MKLLPELSAVLVLAYITALRSAAPITAYAADEAPGSSDGSGALTVIVIIVVFTAAFVSSAVITYKLRTAGRKESQHDDTDDNGNTQK